MTMIICKFHFAFYVIINSFKCKNSHIRAGYGPQWKDQKTNYLVRQILTLFHKFVTLIFG